MGMGTSKKQGQFTDINITPLTDIFLVLLIIMMVIAPMFQNVDQKIEIPEINSGISVEQKMINVAVTKEGAYYVNKVLTSRDELVNALNEAKAKTSEKALVLQADKATKNKDVLAVIQAAQAAGLEKLTIAGEPLSKSSQKELEKQNKDKTE